MALLDTACQRGERWLKDIVSSITERNIAR